MKIRTLTILSLALATLGAWGKTYTLTSPDGQTVVTVDDSQNLTWAVDNGRTQVLLPSAIGMTMSDGKHYGTGVKVVGTKTGQDKDCRSMTLRCTGDYNVEFRAYNGAACYRFVNITPKQVNVVNERAEFRFAADYEAFIPYVNDNRAGERYCYSFESYYDEQRLSEMFPDSLAITPLAATLPEGKRAVIMEANQLDYPGMFLKKGEGHSLVAEFAPYPLEEAVNKQASLNLVPTKRADYIARVTGRKFFPWRVVVISTHDTDLLTCDIATKLGPKSRLKDTAWIKPGKVAWDWWNNWNLSGVDFPAGMNTETYRYYIDFAAANGLEYIIIDEGWSNPEDLLDTSIAIDLPALVGYAAGKGVGIILWSSWRNLVQRGPEKMEEVMAHYAKLGIKGFKVDFFDRDDQHVMESACEVAECAARHRLVLDYHGMKPSGLQLAYPNILNFEGVKGLENSKWEPRSDHGPLHDQPRYDCTIPYLRMLPGPLDYTPGAMSNATRDQFFGNNNHPMSQGTRVHQMAMYTIFHAPLQMLADSPTMYMKNQPCTDFIAAVPTVWDETVAIDGRMGDYVVMARRKGDTWWVAAMGDWQPRDITIDLSRLRKVGTKAVVFEDGINADREATDYKRTEKTLRPGEKLTIHLAPGGGWTARIVK